MRIKLIILSIVVVIVSVLVYLELGKAGLVPTYRCGSTMGPNGPVSWCKWIKGKGVVVG